MVAFLTASEAPLAFFILLYTVVECVFTAHNEALMFARSASEPSSVKVR